MAINNLELIVPHPNEMKCKLYYTLYSNPLRKSLILKHENNFAFEVRVKFALRIRKEKWKNIRLFGEYQANKKHDFITSLLKMAENFPNTSEQLIIKTSPGKLPFKPLASKWRKWI